MRFLIDIPDSEEQEMLNYYGDATELAGEIAELIGERLLFKQVTVKPEAEG